MKKMPYAIIFIIILVLLVFVGCMKFTNELPGMNADASTEDLSDPENTLAEATTIDPVKQAEEEEAIVDQMVEEMREALDDEGQTIFSEQEISSAEVSLRQEIESSVAAMQNNPSESRNQQAPATQAPVTQQNQSTPATQPSVPATTQQAQSGVNEFEILRSGTFYCRGSMADGSSSSPLELAVTPSSVYMLSKFDTIDIGLLVSDGTTYMIYPQEKVYLKLSALVKKMMGLDDDDMLSPSELGFTDLDPLSSADSVTDGTFDGRSCTIYTFGKSGSGKQVVYMDGNSLLGLETYSASGSLESGTHITYITGSVPADKINPPADYSETTLTKFMTMLASVM